MYFFVSFLGNHTLKWELLLLLQKKKEVFHMNALISILGKLKFLTSGTFKCFFWLRISSKTPTCIYQMKDEKIFETFMVADFKIFGRRNFCGCCKKSIGFRNFENMSRIQICGPPKNFVRFPKNNFFVVQLFYVSYQKIFGYHTLDSYLCTKSQKF